MRYFLDTEYNGMGGQLLSIGLVPEHGDQEFYAVLEVTEPIHEWVERHVMPYLRSVPPGLDATPMSRAEAAHELEHYLGADPDPLVVADWPEDLAQLCNLIVTGPAEIIDLQRLRLEFHRTPGFSTARNSRVPHNALHDARALREHLVGQER
jgi:hypothetical protein